MEDLYNRFKLLKHLDRLVAWRNGDVPFTIFADFDISNRCNNQCPKCVSSLLYDNCDKTIVKLEDAKRVISQLKDIGGKAITFAGGGDPACNPHLEEIIRHANHGMDVAMYTNGLGLNGRMIEAIVDCCTWMRISFDADGPEMYRKTHGMNKKAFERVLSNIEHIVKAKKETGSELVIGLTYLLGPHTIDGIYNAAKFSKELGVDYIRFRPFFMWEDEKRGMKYKKEEGNRIIEEVKRSMELSNKTFEVSCDLSRCASTIEKKARVFDKCYLPNFVVSITADLNVYPCCVYKNNKEYCMGDLKQNSLKEVILSERAKNISEAINISDCPNPCMLQNHVELLWAVRQPIKHQNFL